MIDPMRAAREDLAFMKAIADDKGPLPTLIGAHMLAVGAPYSLNFILIWAIFAGHAPWWPHALIWATWLPGTLVYTPLCIVLTLRGLGHPPGPTARLFIAAWMAVGVIVLPTVAVMMIAQLKTGVAYAMLWPALSFIFWGGAWASLAVIRRKAWHGIVGVASMATGLAGAAMIQDTAAWLVMALGMLLVVALPGVAILSRAPWAD